MSGWGMLAWAVACGVGVLTFLTVVAHAVEWVVHDLRRCAQRERQEPGKNLEKAEQQASAA